MIRTINKILSWFFAITFLIGAAATFADSAIAALVILAGAVLFVPFMWGFIRKVSGRNLPNWAFVLAGFVLSFTGIAISSSDDQAKAKEQGFASVADYRAAKRLHLDPVGYAGHLKTEAAAEEQRKEAAKIAQAKAAEAEAAAEELRKEAEKIAQAEAAEAERQQQAAQKLAEAQAAEVELKKVADCKADLQCWAEKNLIDAVVACKPVIESMAKYDYDWTDGITAPFFKKLAWHDKKKGYITYFGDEVKMQNGFGNFMRQRYACIFDATSKSVIDVTLEAGRL